MFYLIEISYGKGFFDALGHTIKKDIEDLGIKNVKEVQTSQLYHIETTCKKTALELLCKELLSDKITQRYKISTEYRVRSTGSSKKTNDGRRNAGDVIIQVWYKKGVTDAVGDTVKKGASDLGIKGIKTCNTGFEYKINGKLNTQQIEKICSGLLANKVIQEYVIK